MDSAASLLNLIHQYNLHIMSTLLSFYIVDRKSGISYDPFYDMGKVLLVDSNVATRKGSTTINIAKLVTGLKERRYRLVQKSGNN